LPSARQLGDKSVQVVGSDGVVAEGESIEEAAADDDVVGTIGRDGLCGLQAFVAVAARPEDLAVRVELGDDDDRLRRARQRTRHCHLR